MHSTRTTTTTRSYSQQQRCITPVEAPTCRRDGIDHGMAPTFDPPEKNLQAQNRFSSFNLRKRRATKEGLNASMPQWIGPCGSSGAHPSRTNHFWKRRSDVESLYRTPPHPIPINSFRVPEFVLPPHVRPKMTWTRHKACKVPPSPSPSPSRSKVQL